MTTLDMVATGIRAIVASLVPFVTGLLLVTVPPKIYGPQKELKYKILNEQVTITGSSILMSFGVKVLVTIILLCLNVFQLSKDDDDEGKQKTYDATVDLTLFNLGIGMILLFQGADLAMQTGFFLSSGQKFSGEREKAQSDVKDKGSTSNEAGMDDASQVCGKALWVLDRVLKCDKALKAVLGDGARTSAAGKIGGYIKSIKQVMKTTGERDPMKAAEEKSSLQNMLKKCELEKEILQKKILEQKGPEEHEQIMLERDLDSEARVERIAELDREMEGLRAQLRRIGVGKGLPGTRALEEEGEEEGAAAEGKDLEEGKNLVVPAECLTKCEHVGTSNSVKKKDPGVIPEDHLDRVLYCHEDFDPEKDWRFDTCYLGSKITVNEGEEKTVVTRKDLETLKDELDAFSTNPLKTANPDKDLRTVIAEMLYSENSEAMMYGVLLVLIGLGVMM